jgi:hypothetical protein
MFAIIITLNFEKEKSLNAKNHQTHQNAGGFSFAAPCQRARLFSKTGRCYTPGEKIKT